MLKRNVGGGDRVVRLAVALAVLYPVFIDPGLIESRIVSWILLLFGLVNIVAFATGYCPVYHLTRFSTNRAATESRH